ncbi:MAG: hypothetical protein M1832_002230 [Thelocarpon impressellum]|nr:MAG: hypothetical protein M1832_002230 [Thelocarpon impressellum]
MAYTTEEGWHSVEDGTRLYTKTWTPEGKIKAKLVFLHGFSNAYAILFPHLASRGVQVFSYDQRGWGRSVTTPNTRGLTGPTSLILSDLTSFLTPHLPPTPSPGSPPVFLMGHSMGGGIALTYLAQGPPALTSRLAGVLTESPFLAFAPDAQASKLKILLGKLAGRILPHHQLVQKLDATKMSRDPEVCQAFVDDPLCHDTGTLEGIAAMLERADDLVGNARPVPAGARIWTGHGTADKVTNCTASRKWTEALPVADKEFRAYEGWFHKLHAEPGEDKVTFANDVADWILARAQATEGPGAAVAPREDDSRAKL